MIDDLAIIMGLFKELHLWVDQNFSTAMQVQEVHNFTGPHVRIEVHNTPDIRYMQCSKPFVGIHARIGQRFYDIGLLADPAIFERMQEFTKSMVREPHDEHMHDKFKVTYQKDGIQWFQQNPMS